TYLGGANQDFGFAIAVDGSGDAVVGGTATSLTFPNVNPIQAPQTKTSNSDGFVSVFNPAGSALTFSTNFGGASNDEVDALTLDSSGKIYIAGQTASTSGPAPPRGCSPRSTPSRRRTREKRTCSSPRSMLP